MDPPRDQASTAGNPSAARELPWAEGLVVGWVVATAAAIWAGGEDPVWRWTFDDSFYYFEIARNLAAGHGSTFDRVNATNGYHPLWMAICAAVYALGLDGMAAVRALIGVQLGLYGAVAVVALARFRAHLAPLPPALSGTATLAGALLAVNPSVANVFVNGLESAVSLPLQAALFGSLIASDRPLPERRGWALPVLLTGAFLARTDAALLTALVLLHGVRQGGGAAFLARVGALPGAALGLFLALNQWAFGAPMQVSGDLKRVAPSAGQWLLVAAMVALALLLGRVSALASFPRLRTALVRGWPVVAFACGVVAYYLGFQTFPRVWYFGPVALTLVVLACAGTADLLALALAEAREKDPAVSPLRAIAPLVAIGGLALGGAAVAGNLLGTGVYPASRANAEAARWVGANLPADAVIGSWDAGVIGYFAPQTVINLDGVVNSVAFKDALRAGTAGELGRAWGITWLLNHSESPDDLRAAAEQTLGPPERFEVERTWPFAVVGGVNAVGMSEHRMAVMLVRVR